MKHERMLNVIGQIDEDLVFEAEHIIPEVPRRRPAWIRFAAAAMAFVFVAFIGLRFANLWSPWQNQKKNADSAAAVAEYEEAVTGEAAEEEAAPEAEEAPAEYGDMEEAAEEEAAEEEAVEEKSAAGFREEDMEEEDIAMFDELSLYTDADTYVYSLDPDWVVDEEDKLLLDGTGQIRYDFVYQNSVIEDARLDDAQLTWDQGIIELPEGTKEGMLTVTVRWGAQPEQTQILAIPLGEE